MHQSRTKAVSQIGIVTLGQPLFDRRQTMTFCVGGDDRWQKFRHEVRLSSPGVLDSGPCADHADREAPCALGSLRGPRDRESALRAAGTPDLIS